MGFKGLMGNEPNLQVEFAVRLNFAGQNQSTCGMTTPVAILRRIQDTDEEEAINPLPLAIGLKRTFGRTKVLEKQRQKTVRFRRNYFRLPCHLHHPSNSQALSSLPSSEKSLIQSICTTPGALQGSRRKLKSGASQVKRTSYSCH